MPQSSKSDGSGEDGKPNKTSKISDPGPLTITSSYQMPADYVPPKFDIKSNMLLVSLAGASEIAREVKDRENQKKLFNENHYKFLGFGPKDSPRNRLAPPTPLMPTAAAAAAAASGNDNKRKKLYMIIGIVVAVLVVAVLAGIIHAFVAAEHAEPPDHAPTGYSTTLATIAVRSSVFSKRSTTTTTAQPTEETEGTSDKDKISKKSQRSRGPSKKTRPQDRPGPTAPPKSEETQFNPQPETNYWL